MTRAPALLAAFSLAALPPAARAGGPSTEYPLPPRGDAEAETEPGPGGGHAPTIVLGVLAAVALGTGGFLLERAHDRQRVLLADLEPGPDGVVSGVSQTSAARQDEENHDLALVAGIAIGAGAALSIAALAVGLTRKGRPRAGDPERPYRVELAPELVPGGAGVSAGVRMTVRFCRSCRF